MNGQDKEESGPSNSENVPVPRNSELLMAAIRIYSRKFGYRQTGLRVPQKAEDINAIGLEMIPDKLQLLDPDDRPTVGKDAIFQTEAAEQLERIQDLAIKAKRIVEASERLRYDLTIQAEWEPWSSQPPGQRGERSVRQLDDQIVSFPTRRLVHQREEIRAYEGPKSRTVGARQTVREVLSTKLERTESLRMGREIWPAEVLLCPLEGHLFPDFIQVLRSPMIGLRRLALVGGSDSGWQWEPKRIPLLSLHQPWVELVGVIPMSLLDFQQGKCVGMKPWVHGLINTKDYPEQQLLAEFSQAITASNQSTQDMWEILDLEADPALLWEWCV